MTSIIIIEKSGEIKEKSVKNLVDTTDLFKSAGFKSAADFKCHTVWNLEIDETAYMIELYGKSTGRAGQENRFELPPPLDNTLFFGNCVAIRKDRETHAIVGLKAAEWEVIYESLYGGFEDIEMSDEDSAEYDSEDDLPKTITGYVKDDFVVDDDEDEVDDDEDDEDEGDNEDEGDEDEGDNEDEGDDSDVICVKPVPKKRVVKPKPAIKRASSMNIEHSSSANGSEQTYLDCTTELTEEDYD
jgi:hypothetical protein